MQSHFMMFRLSDQTNPSQGTVSAVEAQASLDAYLSQGWKVAGMQGFGANNSGAMVVILLVRDAQPEPKTK